MGIQKIKLSLQFKTIISHLKVNPRMYPMVTDDVNIRHFIIKNIDFCYVIDNEKLLFLIVDLKIQT